MPLHPRPQIMDYDFCRQTQPNSAPPSCHACAPHHRETRIDAIAGIARADADEIVEPTEPSIPADQRAQPVTAHYLVTIEMSPVRPFTEATIASKANVQIIGNANEPKLQGVESQVFLQNLAA